MLSDRASKPRSSIPVSLPDARRASCQPHVVLAGVRDAEPCLRRPREATPGGAAAISKIWRRPTRLRFTVRPEVVCRQPVRRCAREQRIGPSRRGPPTVCVSANVAPRSLRGPCRQESASEKPRSHRPADSWKSNPRQLSSASRPCWGSRRASPAPRLTGRLAQSPGLMQAKAMRPGGGKCPTGMRIRADGSSFRQRRDAVSAGAWPRIQPPVWARRARHLPRVWDL